MTVINNIIRRKLGVTHPSQLSGPNAPSALVYESGTVINTVSYFSDIFIIQQAAGITNQNLLNKLLRINGVASIGGKKENIHIYHRSAQTADGYLRICYIKESNNGQSFTVKECLDTRGAKYSAFFQLLLGEVAHSEAFKINSRTFTVDSTNIDLFVDIINILISDHLTGKFMLVKNIDFDNILLQNNRYYYDRVYWQKPSDQTNSIPPIDTQLIELLLAQIFAANEIAIDDHRIDMSVVRQKALSTIKSQC